MKRIEKKAVRHKLRNHNYNGLKSTSRCVSRLQELESQVYIRTGGNFKIGNYKTILENLPRLATGYDIAFIEGMGSLASLKSRHLMEEYIPTTQNGGFGKVFFREQF